MTAGAVHVGKLPADDGDIEAGLRRQVQELLAALHGVHQFETSIAFQHLAECRHDERIAFGADNAHALPADCFVEAVSVHW
ncbi:MULTISPECIES: hypothetical protein [unclassified Mesorhizobium]|uniref:hypothetical protein n=1 Tax=unclassified Mesorhizobium TaxID=325217 RepID=UPI0016727B33|nr:MULTISPECIES: hypothetical protein [unclassified Mesorhizobium]